MVRSLNSAIFKGWIRHRRYLPKAHDFRYRIFYAYLDLDELPTLLRLTAFLGTGRLSPIRFRRADYLGDPNSDLKEAVLDLVHERTGLRLNGRVCMLTHLRYFGHCFNPVTFYYCYEKDGTEPEVVVAEINNTPWDERHAYVLARGDKRSHRHRFAKDFHVSPFMPMNQFYDWRFGNPGEKLSVHMRNLESKTLQFDATLMMEREAWSSCGLRNAVMAYPFVTVKAVAAIYYQAFRLWLKRVPFYDHPAGESRLGEVEGATVKS